MQDHAVGFGTRLRYGEVSVESQHLDELIRLDQTYWWHVAKRKLVTGIVQSRFPAPGLIVEGGFGSGANLAAFRDLGYGIFGMDTSVEAVSHARSRGLDRVCQHDLADPWPVPDRSARAVILLDVLEHMEEPVEVLKQAARVIGPQGGVVVTVPAHQWLFSDWDRQLGHFRRYAKRKLRREASDAGLCARRLSYWNAFTLPAAVLSRGTDRILGRKRNAEFPRVSPGMNAILIAMAKAERGLQKTIGLPAGLSLVGVFTK